jgi:hypothetical protein
MANDSTSFFYWYRRYKVRAVDMTAFQTAMTETARGLGEGTHGAAVLRGFEVVPVSGYMLAVSGGITTAASGYLGVMNSGVVLDATAAATGALPCRSLVVTTPVLTDANTINSPTAPFNQVPLNQLQQMEVRLIPGTPALNPAYPAKGANDVIVCGIMAASGIAAITAPMLDFEARESIGANSLIAQNQVHFDDRLRPYRNSAKVMGVKPSQSTAPKPIGFAYPGRSTPSLYPLSGGLFTDADSFVDFSTGTISGGDTTSSSFTPTVPTGNGCIVCSVTLSTDDELHFSYGTQGTLDECLDSIRNQIMSGPGSIATPDGNYPLAYVIVTSAGGSFSDIQIIDARAFLSSGGGGSTPVAEEPTGTISPGQTVFTLSQAPSSKDGTLVFIDGILIDTDRWILSGNQITFDLGYEPQDVGQRLWVVYPISFIGGGGSGNSRYTPFGSESSPVTSDGTSPLAVSADDRQARFLASTGGAVTVVASPQVAAGTNIGQDLLLTGTSDTDYLELNDGNGLKQNGAVLLKSGQTITYFWTGSVWKETSRS